MTDHCPVRVETAFIWPIVALSALVAGAAGYALYSIMGG